MLIPRGTADVWLFDASAATLTVHDLTRLLSAGERARAVSLLLERDRERFVLAHACLRVVLARYVSKPSAALVFGTGVHGKPFLQTSGAASPIRFNLSHAGPLTLVAVTDGVEVGVDVEPLRSDRPFADMARTVFTAEEAGEIAALPEPRRMAAFLRCWVRKEALVKAHGGGLAVPLNGFRLSVDPDAPPRIIWVRDEALARARWALADVDVGPGGVGAVAVAGTAVTTALRALSAADLQRAADSCA